MVIFVIAVLIAVIGANFILARYVYAMYDALDERLEETNLSLNQMYARLIEMKVNEQALESAEAALVEKEEEIDKLKIENEFYKGMLFK